MHMKGLDNESNITDINPQVVVQPKLIAIYSNKNWVAIMRDIENMGNIGWKKKLYSTKLECFLWLAIIVHSSARKEKLWNG